MAIEIVRDFDGLYYINGLSTSEYVSYNTLKAEARRMGYTLPNLSTLKFEQHGRKAYAQVII